MAKINSRVKGKVGEREWANYLKEKGYSFSRSQQVKGTQDSFDVMPDPSLPLPDFPVKLWEVKRVQNLNITKVVEQSAQEAEGELFAVAHRKNHKPWLVTMLADDFFRMIQCLEE